MTNKQWYVFSVKNRYGLHRYLLQHDAVEEFSNTKEYTRWFGAMRDYFVERTGFKTAHIVAIEPSELAGVYGYEEVANAS